MFLELPTFETLAVTLVVTTVRTIAEASPTILGGVVTAAYLRTSVEPLRIQAAFCGQGGKGVVRAALIGATLPVCSIGVLPVLAELRRMGLSVGKLMTVAIVAPLVNPFAVLYGVSVLSTSQMLMIVVATAIAAFAISDVSSRFAILVETNPDVRPAGLTGGTRLRNLLIASSRLLTGMTLIGLLIAIGGSAIVASILRSGAFYEVCGVGSVSGPIIASLLSIPQYVSPSRGIIQFAGIGNANMSLGTGLAIYVFGTAVSAASILAALSRYGLRRLSALMIAMLLVISVASYAAMVALPRPIGDVAETSALDGLTQPSSTELSKVGRTLSDSLSFLDPLHFLSLAVVLVLLVIGAIVRAARIEYRNDDPEIAARQNARRMSKAIPASQLGLISVLGIGALFLISAYIFLPSPSESIKEIETIRLDASIAIRSGRVDLAIDRISAWDSAAAGIPLAAAIRGSFPTYQQRKLTRDLRTQLRSTREMLSNGDLDSALGSLNDLERLQSETKNTFTGSSI